jgi:hypothetical protein
MLASRSLQAARPSQAAWLRPRGRDVAYQAALSSPRGCAARTFIRLLRVIRPPCTAKVAEQAADKTFGRRKTLPGQYRWLLIVYCISQHTYSMYVHNREVVRSIEFLYLSTSEVKNMFSKKNASYEWKRSL